MKVLVGHKSKNFGSAQEKGHMRKRTGVRVWEQGNRGKGGMLRSKGIGAKSRGKG